LRALRHNLRVPALVVEAGIPAVEEDNPVDSPVAAAEDSPAAVGGSQEDNPVAVVDSPAAGDNQEDSRVAVEADSPAGEGNREGNPAAEADRPAAVAGNPAEGADSSRPAAGPPACRTSNRK
jgi:hypothetical protein